MGIGSLAKATSHRLGKQPIRWPGVLANRGLDSDLVAQSELWSVRMLQVDVLG